MKRKLILSAAGLTILVIILTFVTEWWTEGRYWESTNNAYLRSNITVISAKVPGRVEAVNVSENQLVAKDDILFSLNKAAYTARQDRATAQVAQQIAALARLQSRVAHQQANIAAAGAEVHVATAELQRAKDDLVRSEALQDKGYTDKQRYDHAKVDVTSARAELARTQAEFSAAETQLAVLATEEAEIEAHRQHAEAELQLAKIQMYFTDVRAPVAGRIGNKHVEVGEYAHVGAHKIALVGQDEIWVSANFKETQLAKMRPGQIARIEVDAFPDEPIEAKIDSLSPASGSEFSLLPADNATGNFTKIVQRVPVKILLDMDNAVVKHLRPGMSVVARVDIRSGSGEQVLSATPVQ